jgi:glyoxylase I family protein
MHIALATSDTRQAIERVREAGYAITVEPKDVQLGALHVTIAFFNGPSGESIEFFQTT